MTKSNQNGTIQSEIKQGGNHNPTWTYYVPGSDAYHALPEETRSKLAYCVKSDMLVDLKLKVKRVYPQYDLISCLAHSTEGGEAE